jgi:hypothetical protein
MQCYRKVVAEGKGEESYWWLLIFIEMSHFVQENLNSIKGVGSQDKTLFYCQDQYTSLSWDFSERNNDIYW